MKTVKTSPYIPTDLAIEKVSENEAKISVYPFESGYAITLAHPVRRLLLNSTVGYAPTAVNVEGASHEFDSIRGIFEDVAIFIINLKNIRFKFKNDTDKVVINYSFTGPKEVKGKDLENDDVEVVTPDVHLATVNEDTTLNFSVIIERGIGYVPSEDIREAGVPEGYIPVDAYFTPVRKAVYNIENMFVEDNPNFEKIVFNILTDGQVDPVTVFKDAVSVMYKQMAVFNDELDILSNVDTGSNENTQELAVLLTKVEDLNLSARSFNCLDKAEIKFLGELVLMDESEIKGIKNLGKKSLEEIICKIEEMGFPRDSELPEDIAKNLSKKLEKLKS
jgi:DNA-directed RNA polymerase subunit alpha